MTQQKEKREKFLFDPLRRVYKSVDDIDLYLGGFLEAAHEDSILGPVFKCIIGDQFARLKKGDKFFYDLGVDQRRAFTLAQLEEIRKTSMARIICDNTDDIDRIQPLAFKMPTSRFTMLLKTHTWINTCLSLKLSFIYCITAGRTL